MAKKIADCIEVAFMVASILGPAIVLGGGLLYVISVVEFATR